MTFFEIIEIVDSQVYGRFFFYMFNRGYLDSGGTAMSDRLENVTQTISRILDGYDIRLRPNFGGEYNVRELEFFRSFFRWIKKCIQFIICIIYYNSDVSNYD